MLLKNNFHYDRLDPSAEGTGTIGLKYARTSKTSHEFFYLAIYLTMRKCSTVVRDK
jgi:hypothetical protein